jgi:hypothetical protein
MTNKQNRRIASFVPLFLVVSIGLFGLTQPDSRFIINKSAVDPRDFGCRADGVNDDSTAFQAVLDAYAGLAPIDIGSGVYRVHEMSVPSGTVLIGSGKLIHSGSVATSAALLRITNANDVVIRGITLDGIGYSRVRVEGVESSIVNGDRTKNVVFDGVKFINSLSAGIEISRATNHRISNCFFLNCIHYGIYYSTDSFGISVVGSQFVNIGIETGSTTPQPCLRCRRGVENVVMSGCSYRDDASLILPATATTMVALVSFSDSGNGGASESCRNITVSGNTATDLNQGFQCYNPGIATATDNLESNFSFIGNTLSAKASGSVYAGVLGVVENVTIAENQFLCFPYGIYVGGYNKIRISGNRIIASSTTAAGDGISLRHTSFNGSTPTLCSGYAVVEGNFVEKYARYPLFMQHVQSRTVIKNNALYSENDRVLQVEDYSGVWSAPTYGSETLVITGNRLSAAEVATYAVWVNSVSGLQLTVVFEDNDVYSASHYLNINGTGTNIIANNRFTGGGGSYPPSVDAQSNTTICGNSGEFTGPNLLTTCPVGSGTVKLLTNNVTGMRQVYGYAAAPTLGTWGIGDIAINAAATGSSYVGWVCIEAGSPGTWKAFGAIAP